MECRDAPAERFEQVLGSKPRDGIVNLPQPVV